MADEFNQKGTRLQDKPRPFEPLSSDYKRFIFQRYSHLKREPDARILGAHSPPIRTRMPARKLMGIAGYPTTSLY